MANSTPGGITPPAPGLEREEPDFWVEDDIPSDDGGSAADTEGSNRSARREERTSHKPERE
jgi:hypothetical protein